jgi:hypothetical protein
MYSIPVDKINTNLMKKYHKIFMLYKLKLDNYIFMLYKLKWDNYIIYYITHLI